MRELYVAELATEYFGTIQYDSEQIIHFPYGLPAFDEETRFLPVEKSSKTPVIFLQSLARPELAFITLPVQAIEPSYRLAISEEDLEALELPPDQQPEIGAEVTCLAIVTLAEGKPPTANMMAPIVVNLRTRNALQAMQVEAGYSHQHLLGGDPGEEQCS